MNRKSYCALRRQRLAIAALLLLKAALLFSLLLFLHLRVRSFSRALMILGRFAALHALCSRRMDVLRRAWCRFILLFPAFGGVLYLIFANPPSSRRLAGAYARILAHYAPHRAALAQACPRGPHAPLIRALQSQGGFPAFGSTQTTYLSPGERFYASLLSDLALAKRYIFLEFFIVQEGRMWNAILDLLARKAKEGVLIRLIYDDLGCFLLLPKAYREQLCALGIDCAVFNPFRPMLRALQNNRDHRKIACIDGVIAYTGGANLADEYINAIQKFGHWKDAAIRLEGAAAWGMTVLFLEMWALCKNQTEALDPFYPGQRAQETSAQDGLVQPYAGNPLAAQSLCEQTLLQILHRARDYVYLFSPYLIPGERIQSALILAARSGVDVRIATPGICDRRMVHMTTRASYRELIEAGVSIYEYTPGFLHAKTLVCDDSIASVGTVNLDYRSLYLHFECGVLLYETKSVKAIKRDMLNTLTRCRKIDLADCLHPLPIRLLHRILRLCAPLM